MDTVGLRRHCVGPRCLRHLESDRWERCTDNSCGGLHFGYYTVSDPELKFGRVPDGSTCQLTYFICVEGTRSRSSARSRRGRSRRVLLYAKLLLLRNIKGILNCAYADLHSGFFRVCTFGSSRYCAPLLLMFEIILLSEICQFV